MTPQTVNAVNLPAMNAMNFPAAILQPPYFDPKRPLAMDYGAIGAIIGHEVSHSFDNQGALFDATGRLHNWWTPEDFKHFEASSAQLVAQYDALQAVPRPGGERASRRWGRTSPTWPVWPRPTTRTIGRWAASRRPRCRGFTGDQQFFVSFAQSWRRQGARARAAEPDPDRRPRARPSTAP